MADPRVLWTPPPDVRERTRIGHYLPWLEARAGLAFDGYDDAVALVGRRPRRVLGSIWEHFDVSLVDRAGAAALADASMPGARWFPGARLNYAEHACAWRAPRRRRRCSSRGRRRATASTLTAAELRDAVARAPRRAAPARRRARRPGGGLPAEHPRDPGRVPGHRAASARSGRRARRSSAPAASSTASARSSRRCCWRRRLPLRRPRSSTAATRSPRSAPRCRACRRTVARCPTCAPRPVAPGRDRLGRAASPSPTSRSRSSRCRSTTRSTCSTARAPPACRSRSCTATAASCSSTSSARPAPRPRPRRPVLLVHHHRLDDVELPGLRPGRWAPRSCCSTATPATPTCGAVAAGRRRSG